MGYKAPVAPGLACPKCGGPVLDKREDPERPKKAPEFRCADKECEDDKGYQTGIWLRDLKKQGVPIPPLPSAGSAASNGSPRPAETWGDVARRYERATLIARHAWSGVTMSPEALVAAAATVFIQASQAHIPTPPLAPRRAAAATAPATATRPVSASNRAPAPAPASTVAVGPGAPGAPEAPFDDDLPF